MYQSLYSSTPPILDPYLLYTKTDILSGIITLPSQTIPIKHLLNLMITQELIHVHLHNASQSYNRPTACSLILDLSLVETLTYISPHSPSHLHKHVIHSTKQIVLKLPDTLEGHHTSELFLNHRLSIIPTTHTVYSTLLDAHNIYRRALLALEVKKTQ